MRARAGLPMLRLALLIAASLILSLVQSTVVLAAAGGILVALILILGLPRGVPRVLFMASLFGSPFLFLVFLLAGLEATGSWRSAFSWGIVHMIPYALRIGDLVLMNLLFIRTTSLVEIMAALRWLRLPEALVLFLSTVVRFIPQILQETRRVIEAQRCRGLTPQRMLTPPGLLAVFIPLFIGQIQRSRDLAISLEIRSVSFSSRSTTGVFHGLSFRR